MPARVPGLPAGLTTRPLEKTDAHAVFVLMAAQEQEDIGEVAIEEADIVSDWAKPSHDLGARSVGVFDGDTLVAYAELMGADRADTSVLPSHRGRGIGTWLAHWLQDVGRRVGSTVIGMPVPQGSPGDRLLEELGFRVRWTSWVLKLPEGASIPERDLPEGYVVRTAEADELRAVHDVLEDAFLEWSERDREPFEDFAAATSGRPGFEPWNLRVAVDPAGDVVGVALVLVSDNGTTGYVDRLAVRRDQRNRGLAQALLVDAFARTREHGTTTSELSTDSRTGALALYERVGMVASSTWVNRGIDLGPTTESVAR
ncbi:GCN5 family acetyltransferase [Nocardioides sp. Root122]|uniref:GNAT family N-acetyltransferase n=1 Tax=Nocardioides TaxID=1839 RepID=UPI00070369EE|nr:MULTISPECIES: GNAT family N-acetyltransferase [Nocardioides]KQV77357.1 GCN5 family acetyltransferase [Nocardioides sp. Root122]MCK9824530.1 GNAT family N-acetyltransferase [Nocardioides cavernae]